MQGRIRKELLSVDVATACAHCARTLHLTVDSELRVQVHDEAAQPLVFSPQVDWTTFQEPNITHAF